MDVVAYVEGNIVVVDGIVDEPVPPRVAVAEIGLAEESSVRDINQTIGNRNTDFHALHFVAPLVFVGPPDAGADAFARGENPRMAFGIFVEGEAAEAALLARISGIVEVDGIGMAGAKRFGKVYENGAEFAFVFERRGAEENFVDLERLLEIKLDARAVLKHFEADGVLAADEFFVGIDADVQVVVEQIVVGAIRAVSAAEDVGLGGNMRG